MEGLLAQASLPNYSGMDGFLGTRGSLMLDFVFVAMIGIVPIMGLSIYLVKYRQMFDLHKNIQVVLAVVLLVTVAVFEIDMRWNGWEDRAAPSQFYQEGQWDWVWSSLTIHLMFATPTAFLWIFVIVQALRKFTSPPTPGQHSRQHVFWARLAALEMTMTAVTGWIFYWLAFVM